VVAALEIPQVEDEGPTFFVRDADGETLFFAGQFLERLEERGFPWTEFRIQEAPMSRHFFGVRAEGPKFEGIKLMPALEHARMTQLGLFARNWGKLDMSLSDLETGSGR
jgi:hypothetical protein